MNHALGMNALLLKLDTIKLNAIEKLNEATEFKTLKMFELWLNTNPNATRRKVIETLWKEAIFESASAVAEKCYKGFKI